MDPKQKKMPGEFELIDLLAGRFKLPTGSKLIGIGDDTAAVPFGEGWQLLTCDSAVAGRHFQNGVTPPKDVGWKIATANVSDLAACGGKPSNALISLVVGEGAEIDWLDDVYAGVDEAADSYGFSVLGGNVTGAKETQLHFFMTGFAERFVSRGGPKPETW